MVSAQCLPCVILVQSPNCLWPTVGTSTVDFIGTFLSPFKHTHTHNNNTRCLISWEAINELCWTRLVLGITTMWQAIMQNHERRKLHWRLAYVVEREQPQLIFCFGLWFTADCVCRYLYILFSLVIHKRLCSQSGEGWIVSDAPTVPCQRVLHIMDCLFAVASWGMREVFLCLHIDEEVRRL